jgi:DNA polymerase
VIYLDIETYCDLDLRKVGLYRYASDPSFRILMLAWSQGAEGPVYVVEGHQESIETASQWIDDPNVLKVAHNAAFERVCFSSALGLPRGQFLDPSQWEDTMALSALAGIPQSLEKAARAAGVSAKDSAGTRLINLFSKAGKTKDEEPEKWEQFVEYARQDVRVLKELHGVLPQFPTSHETQVWRVDQLINDRGIQVDLTMVEWALEQDKLLRDRASAELRDLLQVDNPGSVVQVRSGLKKLGLPLDNLRAQTIKDQLARDDLTQDQRKALELRTQLALVASKKYEAMSNRVSPDGRLRGEFFYHGAHTGRWSGRGVQLQNLPRAQVDSPEAVALDALLGLPATPQILKGSVRASFVGPFVVSDYAAIEARVLAWLAREQWALDAFAGGRDIYVETAKRMGGLTRAQGKVAVLALGYQGGINSLKSMGAQGSNEYLARFRDQWRKANPNIVKYWSNLEEAFAYGGKVGPVQIEIHGRDRHIVLPSGRRLYYRNCEFSSKWVNGQLHESWHFDSPRGRMDTYGGRLAENITQAVSRDILADLLVRLEEQGLPVVGHVHDEVLVEGTDSDKVVEMMRSGPEWSKGLPLDAEAFVTARYRKG